MPRRLPVIFSVLASIATSTAPAAAAEPTSPTPAPVSDPSIAVHVRRGDKARLGGRWREAASAYADALAAADRARLSEQMRAAILGELGVVEVALRRFRDGAEHLHRSLKHEEGLTTDQKERYRRARANAVGEVAILIVAVKPADAQIIIDSSPIPERRSGHILFLEPGQHTVRARLPGFTDAVVTQDAPKGGKVRLALHLPQPPPQQLPATGAAVTAAPERSQRTRAVSLALPRDVAGDVRTGALIAAGVGAVMGTGALLATIPVDNAIEDHQETFGQRAGFSACTSPSYKAECDAQHARLTARAWLTGIGWTALGVSGTIATIAVSSYLWGGSEKKAASVRVDAITTGAYAGVAMHGAW